MIARFKSIRDIWDNQCVVLCMCLYFDKYSAIQDQTNDLCMNLAQAHL